MFYTQNIKGKSFNTPYYFFDSKNDSTIVKFDILGSLFYFLSGCHYRYLKLDDFGRFDHRKSIFFKKKLNERFLCEEYLYHLTSLLGIEYKSPKKEITLTCDIDRVFSFDTTFLGFLKSLAADVFYRKDLKLLLKRFFSYFLKLENFNIHFDPYNSFSEFLNLTKKFKINRLIFFVLTATNINKKNKIDNPFPTEKMAYKNLFRWMNSSFFNFDVGIHPSYTATNFQDDSFKLEKDIFDRLNIKNKRKSVSRAHYLRYSPKYYLELEKYIIKKDFSLGSEYFLGFVNGTIRPINPYNFELKRAIDVTIYPLPLMDVTCFNNKNYLKTIDLLISNWLIFGGDFVILWHNNYLKNKKELNKLKIILNKFSICVE